MPKSIPKNARKELKAKKRPQKLKITQKSNVKYITPRKIKVGKKYLCTYKDGHSYECKVVSRNSDHTFNIKWKDGSSENTRNHPWWDFEEEASKASAEKPDCPDDVDESRWSRYNKISYRETRKSFVCQIAVDGKNTWIGQHKDQYILREKMKKKIKEFIKAGKSVLASAGIRRKTAYLHPPSKKVKKRSKRTSSLTIVLSSDSESEEEEEEESSVEIVYENSVKSSQAREVISIDDTMEDPSSSSDIEITEISSRDIVRLKSSVKISYNPFDEIVKDPNAKKEHSDEDSEFSDIEITKEETSDDSDIEVWEKINGEYTRVDTPSPSRKRKRQSLFFEDVDTFDKYRLNLSAKKHSPPLDKRQGLVSMLCENQTTCALDCISNILAFSPFCKLARKWLQLKLSDSEELNLLRSNLAKLLYKIRKSSQSAFFTYLRDRNRLFRDCRFFFLDHRDGDRGFWRNFNRDDEEAHSPEMFMGIWWNEVFNCGLPDRGITEAKYKCTECLYTWKKKHVYSSSKSLGEKLFLKKQICTNCFDADDYNAPSTLKPQDVTQRFSCPFLLLDEPLKSTRPVNSDGGASWEFKLIGWIACYLVPYGVDGTIRHWSSRAIVGNQTLLLDNLTNHRATFDERAWSPEEKIWLDDVKSFSLNYVYGAVAVEADS